MEAASLASLTELQAILRRMPFHTCCILALPEFGVEWREVANAISSHNLPMTSVSIARVLTQHVSTMMSADEVEQILRILKLKLVMTQHRTWHTLSLLEPTEEQPAIYPKLIEVRIRKALGQIKTTGNMRAEVNVASIENLIYLSIQMISQRRQGSTLYVAIPLGEPVIFVSSFTGGKLLKAVVEGLGYNNYENVALFGPDIKSLLRIINRNYTEVPEHLAEKPEYNPKPTVTANGIDYTSTTYDKEYVENILGPNPPVLTDLHITSNKPFYDNSKLNKMISLKVKLKSDNVASTVKNWVTKKVIAPDSAFVDFFHEIKSNELFNGE